MILSTDTAHLILLALFVVMAFIQGWYWLWYYRRAAFAKPGTTNAPGALPPLSVVICARNEAENLLRFLPSVLEQDYPSYEVVVVNDCSEDNTFDILGDMMKRYPHLKVSMIQKDPGFTHTKKLAMLIGIKAAKNDMLVFTDADCRPATANWLREVAAATKPGTDIVIGYGGYLPGRVSSTGTSAMKRCSPACSTSGWPWRVFHIWALDETSHTGAASSLTGAASDRITI